MGNCQLPPKTVEDDEPVRIGLISDIQYADRDDGVDFDRVEQRHFRHSLQVLKAAAECWNKNHVNKVVQLGNLIDGTNAKLGTTWGALRTVLTILGRSTAEERIDLVGNHELYNIRRAELALSGLRCTGSNGLFYRSMHLGSHWEAIVLDPYEHALIGRPEEDHTFAKAEQVLLAHNPQVINDEGCKDWFKGLPLGKYRYVPVNGGMSNQQLAWLEQALRAAEAERRRVLVFTHVPLYEPAAKAKTLLWNCEDALAVLHNHKDTVVAVVAGHDHDGGYAVDHEGIHHVTMHSALTTPIGTDCFAFLECFPDGTAHLHSYGDVCGQSELCLAKGVPAQPETDRALSKSSLASKGSQASTRSTASSSRSGYPSELSHSTVVSEHSG